MVDFAKLCADSKAAKALHTTIGELLREEVPKLPSDRSREKFWCLMMDSVEKNLLPKTQPPIKKKPSIPTTSTSYDEAMDLIDQIRDLVESICSAGQDFADSVSDKAESIAESVERSQSATDGQLQALENMLEGLQRWFHD